MEAISPTEEWLKKHAPMGSGASLPDGTVVGQWRIAAFVARGGSGEVYRVIDDATGHEEAALKILHRDDAAARERFTREMVVMAKLRGGAFPEILDTGEFEGHPWYAAEYLRPLETPSSDGAVARLVLAVCRAAGALHALGYVHRDIKPANIMSRGGEPVLIDLGLLKKAGASAVRVGGTVSVVDGRPVGVGTPGYSAPEQFLGGEISPSADIHAIGVLASTCFGGKPPRAWRGIIRRATSSLPSERYPDVASLARAVRLRHLPTAIALGAVAVVLAAVAVASLSPKTEVPSSPEASVTLDASIDATEPKATHEVEEASAHVSLGEAISFRDDAVVPWSSDGENPWVCRSGDNYIGFKSAIGRAIPGKPAVMSAVVDGPGRLVFHFRRNSYAAELRVHRDPPFKDVPSSAYANVTSEPGEWEAAEIMLMEGTNSVAFSVFANENAPESMFQEERSVEIDAVRVLMEEDVQFASDKIIYLAK